MNRASKMLVIAVFLVVGQWGGATDRLNAQEDSKAGERPSLVVPRADTPVKVDGNLDEPAWQKAVVAKPFLLLGGKGAPAKQGTEALVTYDDTYLYVAFRCQEPNPAGMKRTPKAKVVNVWDDDCVEIFLDPERAKQAYMHFAANSLGAKMQMRRLPPQMWFTQWYDSGEKGEGITRWEPSWRALPNVGQAAWTMEIAIPFSEIGRTPSFGEAWNANFCRERKVEGEENSSWARMDGDSFHTPESFGQIVFGGGEVKKPTIVAARPKRYAAQAPIIPRPQEMRPTGSSFEFTPDVAIYVPQDKPGALAAAQFFKDDVASRGGYELQIVTNPKALQNLIIFDHEPLSEVTKKFMPSSPKKMGKGKYLPLEVPSQPEGYLLDVRPSVTVLAGRAARGVWDGVQTLRQLVRFEEDGVRISGVRIMDWPALAVRGWHFSSVHADEVATFRRLVDLFTLLKFNTLIIEVDDNMKYDRHPDIAGEKALSKSQLAELVAYAKERQFEVIPQVQTFGHFSYVLNKEAYKGLAENLEPNKKWGRYTYCPSNPETYKLVFDMFDEVIEVFKPKYFHIGHDEIAFADVGKCERCKARLPKDLLAEDVKKLYDYLTAKGLKVMMWCDPFEVERNGGPPLNTAEALPLIPKDIIICEWHYDAAQNFPSLKFFKEKGFPVIACGWYKPGNVYNFCRDAAAQQAMGYCGTTWWALQGVCDAPEMMSAFILTAENAWTPGNPTLEQMPYPPTDTFRRVFDFGAKEEMFKEYFTVDLRQRCNAYLFDTAQRTGWFGLGPDYDMSQISGGMQWLGSMASPPRETPFDIISPARSKGYSCIILSSVNSPKDGPPDRAWQIGIGEKAKYLCFLHTTSRPQVKELDVNARYKGEAMKVGWYEITYEDESKERIDLIYGKNIADWNTRLGASDVDVVWRGKTRAGARIQVCAYEWKNPKPDVTIRAVDFASTRSEVSPVLIAITGKR